MTRRWRAWRFAARQFCALRAALDDAGAGGMVEAKVALPEVAENVLEVPVSKRLSIHSSPRALLHVHSAATRDSAVESMSSWGF